MEYAINRVLCIKNIHVGRFLVRVAKDLEQIGQLPQEIREIEAPEFKGGFVELEMWRKKEVDMAERQERG